MWLASLLFARVLSLGSPPRPQRAQHRRPASRRRPGLEPLEDRCVPSSYNVVDLGAFSPSAINNVGQVAGAANGDAAMWQNGTLTDLGTLGGTGSAANAINDAGQVVGSAGTPDGYYHAALWQNGMVLGLGTLSGGLRSRATAINNLGQVVGWADVFNSSFGKYLPHAFRWDSGNGMQDLGTFGGTWAKAMAINNNGQIVGTAFRTYPNNPEA